VHWWRALFGGAGAAIVAVLILGGEPLQSVNTWYLIASLGLLMIGAVAFLERRRQHLPVWRDAWRERFETWA
jgi:hypothetical protein